MERYLLFELSVLIVIKLNHCSSIRSLCVRSLSYMRCNCYHICFALNGFGTNP